MVNYQHSISILLFSISSATLSAQVNSVDLLDQKYVNWHNHSFEKESILGIASGKAYQELLKNKPPRKTIIVAVIDSGVDIDHEELKDKIWVNEDEIPNNKIDDDNNGYVDDVHGWNFIGNEKGENLFYENTEYTRLFKQLNPQNEKDPIYAKAKLLYQTELNKRKTEKENILKFEANYLKVLSIIKDQTGLEIRTINDLQAISSSDKLVLNAKAYLSEKFKQGVDLAFISRIKKRNNVFLEKFLNLDFNPRQVVGDNPYNLMDSKYGNPDVKGPRSNHGTSVAGIIAATRNNGIGINGLVDNVKIMVIRSTPEGDERDKDVALGIKYAVENGAHIINMSFGKQLSPQKEMIDIAVKLAEERNVLIVHGSGNSGLNIDENESYPSDRYMDGSEASNWINVGASTSILDDHVPADFSNYGKRHVDLFAPGQDIVSLDSTNTYSMNSGTSLAAPIVSGVAALVLSRYPELTVRKLIELLMVTTFKIEKLKVLVPNLENDKRTKVRFSELSKSGGIVNAYEALKRAEELYKESK
jgi:subtilisin family serine protease